MLKAVTAATEAAGGKVESFDFVFGDNDAYLIVDYPDATTAVSAVLAVTAAGGVMVWTVALLTPAEVDTGVKMQSVLSTSGELTSSWDSPLPASMVEGAEASFQTTVAFRGCFPYRAGQSTCSRSTQ